VRGGTGGSTTYCGGLGGRGLVSTSSQILASGGSISGGFGGWSWTGGGAGGIGAFLNASTTLRTLGCPVQGGTGSSTGNATGGAGAITALPGLARRIGAPVIARADQPLAVSWQGTSNDVVWLPRSVPFDHVFLGTLSGDWLTEMPPPTRLPFAGIASVLGHLDASLVLPSLAPGAPFATIAVQGLTLAPIPPDPLVVTGSTTTAAQAWERGWLPRYGVLASVRHALVIDPATGVDCNSNGVNDLLDVLLGTSPDANGDLRPDECP
jgi:hypothetical protein